MRKPITAILATLLCFGLVCGANAAIANADGAPTETTTETTEGASDETSGDSSEETPDTPAQNVKLVTTAEMIENKDRLLPAFNHGGAERLSINNGVISCWADKHFFYGEEVEGVEIEFRTTETTTSGICFGLRTTGGGAMWGATGYYAYVTNTYVQICKFDGVTSWDKNILATLSDVSLLDTKMHDVIFYAADSAENGVEIYFEADGKSVKCTDETDPLPIANTEFKIAGVNGGPSYEVGKSTAQEGEYTVNYKTAEDMIKENKLLPEFNYTGTVEIEIAEGYAHSAGKGAIHYYTENVDAVDFDIVMDNCAGTQICFALRSTGNGTCGEATVISSL